MPLIYTKKDLLMYLYYTSILCPLVEGWKLIRRMRAKKIVEKS